MSPSPDHEVERRTWERSPEPGWIDSPGGPLFCWYHAPRGPARSRAILLCEPLGHDRMNLHLTYRHLALALSHAGYPVMRFDYAGTGDSGGSPRDPGWAENWTLGLNAAADALLQRSGAKGLALFGARMGGTLAAQFASTRAEVDALLLWGPYLNGRTFLRNERALHQLINANQMMRRPTTARPTDQEFFGFLYDDSARQSLEQIDLLKIDSFAIGQARIFAWDADSPEDRLATKLAETKTETVFSRPTDFSSEDSLTQQSIPQPLLTESLAWLNELERERPVSIAASSAGRPLPTVAAVQRDAPTNERINEEAVHFGDDGGLFGILSHAVGVPESDRQPALIFVSGGNNMRAGINRNYTEWSRDAALRGISTLRFDIRGLGDSPAIRASDLNVLYRPETLADLRSAIDYLEAKVDCREVILCGLCAGAFQALHLALDDPRVIGVIFLDLLRWDLDPSQVRRPGFIDRRRRNLEHVSQRLRKIFAPGTLAPESSLLATQLSQLAARGVDLVAVGCLGRGGHEQFADAIEPVRQELERSGHFRFEGLDSTDHVFSPLWAQEWIANLLRITLDRLTDRRGPSEKVANDRAIANDLVPDVVAVPGEPEA